MSAFLLYSTKVKYNKNSFLDLSYIIITVLISGSWSCGVDSSVSESIISHTVSFFFLLLSGSVNFPSYAKATSAQNSSSLAHKVPNHPSSRRTRSWCIPDETHVFSCNVCSFRPRSGFQAKSFTGPYSYRQGSQAPDSSLKPYNRDLSTESLFWQCP